MARKDVINGLLSQDMTDANDNFIELYGEIEAARDGETSLLFKEQDQDTNIASVTNEVIAARDGKGNLLAQIDDLQAAIIALLVGSGVPVTANDTTPGYLSTKVVSTDGSVSFSVSNPGGDEKLDFSASATLATVSASANITLTSSSSVYQNISMTATGKSVILPDATTLPEGRRYVFYNSGSYNFTVLDSASAFKALCVPGEWATLTLADNATAAGSWLVSGRTISSRVKTVLNAMISEDIAQCKMTTTTTMVIWKGTDADGYCAVLTWVPGTPAITVSNILEFDTTNATGMSCCRMTDTVGIIGYVGADGDGYICAVTYNGTDTLTLTDTHEFADVDSISDVRVCAVYPHASTGKIGIVYVKANTYSYGQILNWTGTEITANTAETLVKNAGTQLSLDLLSGAVDSASMIMAASVNAGSSFVIQIAWNGTTLTPSTSVIIRQSQAGTSVVALSADYFIASSLEKVYSSSTTQTIVVLGYWSGTALFIRRTLVIEGIHNTDTIYGGGWLTKTDADTLCLVCPGHGDQTYAYKIKAIGSTTPADCILNVESTAFVDIADNNIAVSALDSTGGIVVYQDSLNSGYLAAKRIDL